MSSRLGHYAGLCLLSGLVMGFNLGGPRLWDRDEPRNAGCAAEMLQRQDWVVPVLNAELRAHKPVLLYWLIMASYGVWGISEWSARLPSALLAIGTVLCTYEMGRRLFSPRAGCWAAVALSTSLMFVVAGRAATPDSTLIFCSTLALTCFVLGVSPASSTNDRTASASAGGLGGEYFISFSLSRLAVVAIYVALGAAVLAKGPVGIVLPMSVMGLFLWVMSQSLRPARVATTWRDRLAAIASSLGPRKLWTIVGSMRPWTGLAISLAVAAPWYVWVGWRTDGTFLRGFFLEHNLGRALQTMEGHRGNILFYPVAILIGFFPWTVFTAPLVLDTVRRLRGRDPWRMGYVLAGSWVLVYVAAFSCAQTKLPSYVTPCYPALALLAGAFIERWHEGNRCAARQWLFGSYGVLTLVGVVVAVATPIAIHRAFPGEEWLGAVGLVPAVAGLFGLWAVWQSKDDRATIGFGLAAVTFAALLCGVAADRVSRHQQYDQLWAIIRARSDRPYVAAFKCLEPSWIFYGCRPIVELAHSAEDADLPTRYVEIDGHWLPQPRVRPGDLSRETSDPFVITTRRELASVQSQLSGEFEIVASVPYFLRNDELILLGRAPPAPLASYPSSSTGAAR